MISVAAKWHGQRDVFFYSDHHDGHDEMIRQIWKLVDEADVVIGYNSRGFDMKLLAREWVVAGFPPPSPYRDVDLFRVVKGRFRFPSNKLAHVLDELGLDGKAETGGFGLWKACLEGDSKAWATMKRYNVADVKRTEELYDRLVPWLPASAPNAGIYVDADVPVCPKCGSADVIRWGTTETNAGRYQRFKCNSCGGYSRAASRLSTTTLRGAA